jgi:hypothetical protein
MGGALLLIACAFLEPVSPGGWARTVECVTIIPLRLTNENDLLFYLLLMR